MESVATQATCVDAGGFRGHLHYQKLKADPGKAAGKWVTLQRVADERNYYPADFFTAEGQLKLMPNDFLTRSSATVQPCYTPFRVRAALQDWSLSECTAKFEEHRYSWADPVGQQRMPMVPDFPAGNPLQKVVEAANRRAVERNDRATPILVADLLDLCVGGQPETKCAKLHELLVHAANVANKGSSTKVHRPPASRAAVDADGARAAAADAQADGRVTLSDEFQSYVGGMHAPKHARTAGMPTASAEDAVPVELPGQAREREQPQGAGPPAKAGAGGQVKGKASAAAPASLPRSRPCVPSEPSGGWVKHPHATHFFFRHPILGSRWTLSAAQEQLARPATRDEKKQRPPAPDTKPPVR